MERAKNLSDDAAPQPPWRFNMRLIIGIGNPPVRVGQGLSQSQYRYARSAGILRKIKMESCDPTRPADRYRYDDQRRKFITDLTAINKGINAWGQNLN